MTDRLSLYNGALLRAGERFLASLSEEREPRRLLDQVWDGGVIRLALEQGQWHFAMRTVQLDYDPGVEPSFGYPRGFEKPTDWVNTSSVSSDEFMRVPLTRYADEAGYWYSDLDTLYIRYVSDDPNFGGDLGAWPISFCEYVESYLASRVIQKLSNSEEKHEAARKITEKLLIVAKNKAAMTQPTGFPARGSWSNSRNRFSGRKDGGNSSGPLIG